MRFKSWLLHFLLCVSKSRCPHRYNEDKQRAVWRPKGESAWYGACTYDCSCCCGEGTVHISTWSRLFGNIGLLLPHGIPHLGILFLYVLKSKCFDLLLTNLFLMCLLGKVSGTGVFSRPCTMPLMSKCLMSRGKVNVSESNKEYDTYRICQMMLGQLFSESESSKRRLSIYSVLGIV